MTGELYSWGYGVLGHGREVSFSKTPTKIQEFSSIEGTVTRVFCGPDNTAVVTGLYRTSNDCKVLQLHNLVRLKWLTSQKAIMVFAARNLRFFRSHIESHLNGRKSENSSLLRLKNTKEIIINHHGIRKLKVRLTPNTISAKMQT